AGNPLHLQTNDNNSGPLINLKLTGSENYRVWANAMKIALQARNKMCYVDGTCTKAAYVTCVSLSNQWERCNAVVLSWLLISIFDDLYLSQVYSENAAEVWKELKETYDKLDGSILFNLTMKINNFKQNGLPVFEYYHKLNSLRREFDILTKLSPCTCDAKSELGKHNQLMKLPIRSSLLTQTELRDVKDAFVIVCREESHRGLGYGTGVQKPIVSSFVSKTFENQNRNQNRNNNNSNNQNVSNNQNNSGFNNQNNKGQYNSLSCKNCGMKGHTIDRCFEIIGYPNGFKRNQNGKNSSNNKGYSSNNVDVQKNSSGMPFTSDQISKLMSLIGDKPGNGIHANMAVGHPNCTTAKIRNVGNLKLTSNIVLFDVLVNPEYCVKDGKLHVGFDECDCIIHDLKRDNILGTGSEARGLYVLGHPSNQLLSILKNRLSVGKPTHVMPCEVCHHAKQGDDDQGSVQIGEEDFYEGNVFKNNDVPTNLFNTEESNTGESNTLRRSSRQSKLPPKLNDYLLNSKAHRQWNYRLSEALVKNDFKQSGHDHSLYTKESDGSFVALLVYVDDIVLTSNDIIEINKVKTFLKSKFKIKDLGELKYFLGIESHMDLGLRVLKYLKGALGSGVNYEKSEHMLLKVYADSDWTKCLVTRRLVSVYCVFFNGCMVSLKSKKQATLSKSSAEAKYKPMATATCEVIWVVNILKDLKITNLLPAVQQFRLLQT
ncbi:ribonuclease H-like domain-containing protein, partial [Tanacetum coccineum]